MVRIMVPRETWVTVHLPNLPSLQTVSAPRLSFKNQTDSIVSFTRARALGRPSAHGLSAAQGQCAVSDATCEHDSASDGRHDKNKYRS